jgi:flagellar export protein FliJ
MARFTFRMATLLKLRESTRDERQSLLVRAQRAADILRQQQETLGQEARRLEQQSRDAVRPGRIDVDHLLHARRYELLLRAQQQDLAQQQQAVDAEIQRRQRALVEANREVRVLELLREKQWARHRDEESRQEIKQLDEVAQRTGRGEEVA